MEDRNTFGSIIGRSFPGDRLCPHFDDPDYCDKGACDEGWDY